MKNFLKWRLYAAVFFSGSFLMIYELVGTRVTSPLIGSSLYVWTAIIGSILVCLSAGNYLRGFFADRSPNLKTLSLFLIWASFFVGLTNWLADYLDSFINNSNILLEIKAVFLSLILFGPASVFLGMISPYVVKLSLLDSANNGKRIGLTYMLSTLGSIVGTFLAGFLLIPLLGTEQLILLISFLLLLLSLFIGGIPSFKNFLIILIIITLLFFRLVKIRNDKNVEFDTAYQRVKISSFFHPKEEQQVVAMFFDNSGIQSLKLIDSYRLITPYLQLMQVYKSLINPPKRVLFIGGAGYTMPSYLLQADDKVMIDVVEIDPEITFLAKKYFGLVEDDRLNSIHLDGRLFLNQSKQKYDLMVLDAFGGNGLAPPFHLITKEAFFASKNILNDDGLLILNVPSVLEGNTHLLSSVYTTLNSVFKDILILASKTNEPDKFQNVILVASKNQLIFNPNSEYEYSEFIKKSLWNRSLKNGYLLTDNYAPVEFLERFSKI